MKKHAQLRNNCGMEAKAFVGLAVAAGVSVVCRVISFCFFFKRKVTAYTSE